MACADTLLKGFKKFHIENFAKEYSHYQNLAEGQSPKTLVIACSDSRVDPSILLNTKLGDIFVIRNVANLVPPYQEEGSSYHGTSAAIEFAVNHLNIEHIVILGHSGCAGINALLNDEVNKQGEFSFIHSWVNIAKQAKDLTIKKHQKDGSCMNTLCEKEAILTSINNLKTFPWIKSKLDKQKIELHGWYFSLNDGMIYVCQNNEFVAAFD